MRFITVFTRARNLSLSWSISIQFKPPYYISWRSISLLSSHLCLDLPSGLFPSGLATKTLYTPLLSPIRATCPAHLIFLDLINRIILGEDYRSQSSSLCSLLHSPVTSSRLGPNIFLSSCPCPHHEAYRGSSGIRPLILNVGTSWWWVVNITPRPLYPRVKYTAAME
jgi:hypothetical protein